MNTTAAKPNRFAGTCDNCGQNVPAGTGRLKGKMVGTGRWLVAHLAGQCPTTQARRQPCSGDVHGPADDECLGARCVQPRPRPTTHRYYGLTWALVLEANEYFDGETEIRQAARAEWERVNAGHMFCPRHGDMDMASDMLNGCWECDMEAAEARRDREDG